MQQQLVLPLALLFIALGASSNAQSAELAVAEGAPLTVECSLRVDELVDWRLDGARPPADLRPAGELAAAGRVTARLAAPAARAQHAGLYTCARRPAHSVRVRVLPAQPAPPAASGEPAATAAAGVASDAAPLLTYYDVGRMFVFNCTLPRAPDAGDYVWRKNGTAVEELADLSGRYKLEDNKAVFRMTVRTTEDDFGNYSCAVGGAAPAQAWELRGRPHAKLPANTNVVEGQKLKLVCKVVGKPYPDVKWMVANATDGNLTDAAAALGERAQLGSSEQGVAGAELVLEAAARADAGVYTCAPAGGVAAPTTVRVKDMYAALWPFLGICAEVFVLCAIILVYEKRRTKPELDDSDTDNHEQKKS